ncbi:MAG: energy-coupling factor ABC transporter ATP-binding protein [Bacilli bacterium]
MNKIVFENVSFRYDGTSHDVLHNLSLAFRGNGCHVLLGANGTGKSTLLTLMNALKLPQNGKITFGNGQSLTCESSREERWSHKKHVGLVFQMVENQLFEYTVRRELCFGLQSLHGEREGTISDERLVEALQLVGLDPSFLDRNPLMLSGGEMRRVATASILLLNTPIVLMDEPTIGLDWEGKQTFVKQTQKLKRERLLVVATHDLNVAYEIGDTFTYLSTDGAVVTGSREHFFTHPHWLKHSPSFQWPERVVMNNILTDSHIESERKARLRSYMEKVGVRSE